jgi:hypothetical protein
MLVQATTDEMLIEDIVDHVGVDLNARELCVFRRRESHPADAARGRPNQHQAIAKDLWRQSMLHNIGQ